MHVFISYAREDLEFAENVRHELERRGFTVWIDELTPAGDDWRQEIDDALRGAFAVVLIVTPDSMASLYVTYEWAFALGAGITVVPLVRHMTEFHPRIDRTQYLDFTVLRNRPWQPLADRLTFEREQAEEPAAPAAQSAGDLLGSLTSREADVRSGALRVLRKLSDPASLALLENLLFPTDGARYSTDIRRAALEALGNYGEAALPLLVRCLAHSDKAIRFDVGPKLIGVGDPAVPDLLTVLRTGSVDARLRATWILGEIGAVAAVPALITALDDKDSQPTVRKRVSDGAADALISIATPDALTAAATYWEAQLSSKRKHWKKDLPLANYAAEQLQAIDTPQARRAVAKWRDPRDAIE